MKNAELVQQCKKVDTLPEEAEGGFIKIFSAHVKNYGVTGVGFIKLKSGKIKNTIMYTTYHLSSAQELTTDILEAIKTAFKEKPVVITIEEDMDETAFLMANPENKAMLLKSIAQDKNGESKSVAIPDNA